MKTKTIKCEITAKQLFFLVKAINKWKRKFRQHFLKEGDVSIRKYLESKLFEIITSEEHKKLGQEYREELAKWIKEHPSQPAKEEKPEVKKKPEKTVWGDINNF